MKPGQGLFVVLPVLNEETALRRLIPDLVSVAQSLTSRFYLAIVDDGSTDGTAALAESFPSDFSITLIRHAKNQGYGASLVSGFRWATARAADHDLVVCMDSDNTHQPVYISSLVRKMDDGYDVVTASYRAAGGRAYGVPWTRRVLSRLVNALLTQVYPLKGIGTYTNGFRAYRACLLRKAVAAEVGPIENGFAGGAEIFLKACAAGARPGEIPFDLHYEERGNESKINIPKTVQGYLRLIRASYRLRSVHPT